jgi:hypothetical protein
VKNEKSQEQKLIDGITELADRAKTEDLNIFEVLRIMLKHLGEENIKAVRLSGEKKIQTIH